MSTLKKKLRRQYPWVLTLGILGLLLLSFGLTRLLFPVGSEGSEGQELLLSTTESYTQPIQTFVNRVRTRVLDPQQYLQETNSASVSGAEGYGVVMLLLAAGTQITEDLSCIVGGILASRKILPYWAATLACALGILIGDILLYLVGFVFGKPALKRAPLKWLASEASISRMAQWYERRGAIVVFLARFVPGLRFPCYVAAGVLRVPLQKFLFYFILAVVAWTPLLVGLAYLIGATILNQIERYEYLALPGLVLLGFLAWFCLHWVIPLLSWRGRRLLLSRWRRLTRWEFWPLWATYLPLSLYILWHGFTHYRSITCLTTVNPGIENGGGLVGESKSRILQELHGAGDTIARWSVLKKAHSLEVKLEQLEDFLQKHSLSLPIVLKPEIGERGQGVAILKNDQEIRHYLESCPGDTLAQEFIPGYEYGVFYYRYPGENSGHILGVTDKRFPKITGDGQSTIERLILMDDRAVCMAKAFLKKFEARLDEVPEAGASIPLTALGTHCRGSLFLDGNHLATTATLQELDRISQHFKGFWFGRYDIRVPSVEDFTQGQNLKVLELNGLSSEATYIYDPKHPYSFGLKTLAKQWRIAYQIASINQAAGHTPLSIRKIFQLFWQYWRRDQVNDETPLK